MKRTFTKQEKELIFESWKRGIGFSDIARIMYSKPGTIFTILRDTGGIKPKPGKKSTHHLTLSEREEIRAGISAKKVCVKLLDRLIDHLQQSHEKSNEIVERGITRP